MIELILCLIAGVFIGWSIGANDAANSLGTAVGSKVLTVRQGIILICIFGFAGAVFEGHHVIKTIGKGIVPLDQLSHDDSFKIAMAASFAGSLWVILATLRKLPISTSHSIVGAVAGAGFAIGAPVYWEKFKAIFLCWILTPLGAAVLSILFYWFFRYIFIRIIPEKKADGIIRFLLIISGCYMAYSWGANDVANATGVLRGVWDVHPIVLALIGITAICIGVSTWGVGVMETVGTGITHLLPMMAVAAQIASAVNVHIYTFLGIPVSTSHSIVGAVFGVGLIHQAKLVRGGVIAEIIFSWAVTPVVAGIMAFILTKFLSLMG